MKKEIKSDRSPRAIGPYSQAVALNGTFFLSGQIAFNADLELVGTAVEEQAHQCLKNLQAILTDNSLNMDQVVKTTVYLKDMNDFDAINEVYGQYFNKPFPARVCIEVARLPKDVKIEIDAIAMA